MNSEIQLFGKGVHNLLDSEIIPREALSESKNWITQDGRIKLVTGRIALGDEGAMGAIYGEIFGYRTDGVQVHWRKAGSEIQYWNGTAWITTIAGLTADADYTFSNYSSLAGTFTFAVGVDGIFKMHNANPNDYISLYDAAVNFKGYAMIATGRMVLWNRPEDRTGIYGSRIDPQNATVYTSLFNQPTTALAGTLAFKAIGPTRNAFGVAIYIPIDPTVNISNIGIGKPTGVTTATPHGLSTGDYVVVQSVVGPTVLNGQAFKVKSVTDATSFFLDTDTTSQPVYVSGGTIQKSEFFKDNFVGGLVGNAGGTGTINYVTGAYTVSRGGTGIAAYLYEDSNIKGITDFTHSATRIAGEGFQFPQDEGGDPILNVLIGLDNAYYSLKTNSVYRLFIENDDLTADNNVFRKQLGIPSWRAATSIQTGIVFMNTSNPDKPEMTILQKNPIGVNVEPAVLFPHFKFANYDYDDCTFDSYERYIIVACKSKGNGFNDAILLCNQEEKTVDITYYTARTFAKEGGILYAGSPLSKTVYKIYNGFDDLGIVIDNFADTKAEMFKTEDLKKERKLRIKGRISQDQGIGVFMSFDHSSFQIVGAVRGTGDYVDRSDPITVGGSLISDEPVGGGSIGGTIVTYPYFCEIRLKKIPKFRTRKIRFFAFGFGYADINMLMDWDIETYEGRIPSKFRQKQNVSLDGSETDLPNPEF